MNYLPNHIIINITILNVIIIIGIILIIKSSQIQLFKSCITRFPCYWVLDIFWEPQPKLRREQAVHLQCDAPVEVDIDVMIPDGNEMETCQSKHCGFCIYLFDRFDGSPDD